MLQENNDEYTAHKYTKRGNLTTSELDVQRDLLKAIFAGVFSESKVIGIDKFVGFLTAWKGSKEQAAFMTTYPLFLLDDMYNKITRRPLCNIVPEDTTPEEVSKFVHDNLRVLENMRPPNDDETDEEEDEEDEEGEDELEKGHKRPKSESSGLRREKREKEKTRQLTIHGARYGWGNDLWHNIDPKHPKGVKDVTDIVVADMENNELNINPHKQRQVLNKKFLARGIVGRRQAQAECPILIWRTRPSVRTDNGASLRRESVPNRHIRFATKLDMTISPETEAPIAELAPLMANIPPARMFEEFLKLFISCCSERREDLEKKLKRRITKSYKYYIFSI